MTTIASLQLRDKLEELIDGCPGVELSGNILTFNPPKTSEEALTLSMVFAMLYQNAKAGLSLRRIIFSHGRRKRLAPAAAYSRQETYWKKHWFVAKCLGRSVPEKTFPAGVIRVEASEVMLFSPHMIHLETGKVVFAVRAATQARLHGLGLEPLEWQFIGLPESHPCAITVPLDKIREITF